MAFLGLLMHFTCLEWRFKVSEWRLNDQNDVLRSQNGIYKVGIAFLGLIGPRNTLSNCHFKNCRGGEGGVSPPPQVFNVAVTLEGK